MPSLRALPNSNATQVAKRLSEGHSVTCLEHTVDRQISDRFIVDHNRGLAVAVHLTDGFTLWCAIEADAALSPVLDIGGTSRRRRSDWLAFAIEPDRLVRGQPQPLAVDIVLPTYNDATFQ